VFSHCRHTLSYLIHCSMSSVAAVSTRTNGSPSSTSHRNAWQMCQSGNLQSPTSCWTATCNHGLRSARCCTTNTRGRCGVPAGDRVLGRRAPLVRGRLSRTQWWRRATNARHPAQRSRTRLHKHCYRQPRRDAASRRRGDVPIGAVMSCAKGPRRAMGARVSHSSARPERPGRNA